MAIKGARPAPGSITPHLVVSNAKAAVEFYRRAFGAEVLYSSPLPFGSGMHFHLRVCKALVMVTDEMPAESGEKEGEESIDRHIVLRSPQALGGTSMLIELVVEDVDAAYRKAVDAGAVPTLPLSDQFWGDRYGWVHDPFGHIWALATVKEELAPEEIQERMTQFMTKMQDHC